MTAFVANTNLIELTGLQSAVDSTYINNAAVTVTITDLDGTEVSGETWPLTMEYVDESDGDYRGVLSHELAFSPLESYRAVIDVDAGEDRIGQWTFKFRPKLRTD